MIVLKYVFVYFVVLFEFWLVIGLFIIIVLVILNMVWFDGKWKNGLCMVGVKCLVNVLFGLVSLMLW